MPPQKSIEFFVNDPAFAEEMGEPARNYIAMTEEALPKELKQLLNANDIVVEAPSVDIIFDYPFAEEHVITLHSPDKTFTRRELARAIAKQYQTMYREEEESTAEVAESHANRCHRLGLQGPGCSLLNRVATHGKWRIWGHTLHDLDLHAAVFDAKRRAYRLQISS